VEDLSTDGVNKSKGFVDCNQGENQDYTYDANGNMMRDQRELLIKANHYNVMAVQKIIEGSVSDDPFLYFRCKLILYGRITFESAINNPNYLFERIDPLVSGESLLSVADRAFSMRFGGSTDKIFPRDYASEIIDYDFGDFPVQGEDCEESDLPKRYSKLWKAYNTK
jgi:hypothetical protein